MPSGPRPAPPPGTARVAISGTFYSSQWANVFYLNLTGSAITQADLQTLANQIGTLWNTDIAPQVPSAVVLNQIDVRYIPTAGSEIRATATVSHPGTGGGTSVEDVSICFVASWAISSFYRGGHPRWYIPGGFQENIVNGKNWSATYSASFVTSLTSFLNSLNAYTVGSITGVTLGTVAFERANAWLSPPVFHPFTSVKKGKNGILGSQRRRLLT